MPELPEVEALARFLDERTSGRTLVAADVAAIAALKTHHPPVTDLVGGTVSGVARHGKWLDLAVVPGAGAPTDRGALHLVLHLARGGWVRWHESAPTTPVRPRLGGSSRGAALALRLRFDDGTGVDLTEAGTRKRLAVHVVHDPQDVDQVRTLGVEPLSAEFTPEVLGRLLGARNQQVKGLLRDQHAIAGIGNAYSDEILHVARVSPFRLTRTFTDDDVAALHDATVTTLRAAVATSAGRPAAQLKDAKRSQMRVHGRTGEACPVCGDAVREVSFADSSLQYCATCQTGGQVLADRRTSKFLR
ncbi:formamidopyrimidine-DNA glycosylase [Isoptericola sp. CG 20/1183]|uniref:Formamidopyrimidine-DNA glycosylase n=1 Tax=Isoptericola halotolerans TaxID=300560 RepID=A0ABX5EGV2_9MICO|nr:MULTISPECIES: DNA-formamidopyrimidine glycosylase family protein [Isoptericola]PRZ05653.1 formamidopyrimidine-DNA glycosylase [Isoptericola halotolerans]PRZ06221.1 formamidopyrimidine-DNA glycosylase [Isoptericola sp. CG 20/1183]